MKRTLLYVVALWLTLASSAFAQQPKKVTDKFFPEPDVEMNIPVFKKKSGFTNSVEMSNFISDLILQYPELIKMESVGKSQRGRDIFLVTISNSEYSGDKLRAFYYARVHGDEPSGTEAMLYFIRQLLEDPSVGVLLEKIDFYIIPMVNPDGAESFTRVTANGIDLNRDQSKLDTPEAKALHATVDHIQPHIAVDYHEYQPIRSDFAKLTSDIISTPWDIMFLYSGNPNVPQVLRDAVDSPFIANIGAEMDKYGLTHHTYFTSQDSFGKVSLTVGGSSPRSTSNAMALKGIISLLMETRGIKLDRVSIKRRTWSAYLTAVNIARTAVDNEDMVRDVVAQAIRDKGDIAVKFSGKSVTSDFKFLDIIKNSIVELKVDARLSNESRVTKSRSLPAAYWLLPSEIKAIETFGYMGIEVVKIDEPIEITVESYKVTSWKEDAEQVAGIHPIGVETQISDKVMTFPAGSYRIDMGQRYLRAVSVLLEPESSSGFVSFRVIESKNGMELPIYREKNKN